MTHRWYRLSHLALFVGSAQLLVAGGILWLHGAPGAFGGDFIAYYSAGTQILAHGWSHLYDLPAQLAAQRSLLAQSGLPATAPIVIPFNYPAPAALIFLPFALLSPGPAVALWVGLNLVLVGVSGVIAVISVPAGDVHRFKPGRVAFACMPLLFLPVDWGLLAGQPVGLVLLLGTVAYAGWRDRHDVSLGISLGLLAALKPQLVVGPAIGLLVLGRRRAVGTLVGVGAALFGLTVALIGVNGLVSYVQLLVHMDPARGNASLAVQATAMVNWRALLVRVPGLNDQGVLLATLAFGALTLLPAGLRCRRWPAQPERAYSAMTVAGILAGYHSHYQDLVVLIPPALAAFLALFAHWSRINVPRLAGSKLRAAVLSGRSTESVVFHLAAPVAVLLLVAAPGLTWLCVGLFALGLLHVWTFLAAPGLALLLIAIASGGEVMMKSVGLVDNAELSTGSSEAPSAAAEPAVFVPASGAG